MDRDEEWIICNRNGSYSSSTASFSNLRTYHGIYVRNTNRRYERFVFLSKLFEEMQVNGSSISLDSNYYRGAIYPHGFDYLVSFNKSPIPVFRYFISGISIEKKVVIDPYDDVVLMNYKFSGKTPDQLRLYPLVAFRNYHTVIRQGDRDIYFEEVDSAVRFSWNEMHFWVKTEGIFKEDSLWYYNVKYPIEEARGSNSEEDLFLPGHFEINNVPGELTVLISPEKEDSYGFEDVQKRYVRSLSRVRTKDRRVASIVNESTKLIAKNNIIAGYYWFGPWSRDALISLPGLLLVPKRYKEARELIMNYTQMINRGLLPKAMSDPGNYEAADSPLWFIYAVYKYFQYSGDKALLSSVYPKITEIIEAYLNGNDLFEIDNSLVKVKKPQLTWMDAKTGDTIFTPRVGKPVEINALWYNALETAKYISEKLGYKFGKDLDEMIPQVKERFIEIFLKGNSILDVSDPDDYSVRPNAVFAFSLPFPVLQNFSEYRNFFSDLVTPFGLRSLSTKDRKYLGKYEGDQYHRDSAYHNGSVWPWLAGPYITASIRSGTSVESLLSYFNDLYSLNYVPEIFDGDPPYKSKGCIIQAWSYAELIRAYFEDLEGGR
ncbi:MAG: amylo-alpha-1,6-glucosidase [Thermoplasmatales archaeon]